MGDFLKKWFPAVDETSDELNKYFNVTAVAQVVIAVCSLVLVVRSFMRPRK